MTPRQLDLAHEFCEKVSADDLLDYLGLATDASTDEARAALKAKRRKMQGMQSNPKFRDEARLLIRHFQSLDAVLAEPSTHVRDMARRRESSHLPILEMTIRGVLAGGPLSGEQQAYLRSNAADLGVSEGTFDALLHRLQQEIHGEGSDTPRTGPSRSKVPEYDPTQDPRTGPSPSALPVFDVGNLDDIDLGVATGKTPSRPRADRPDRHSQSPIAGRVASPDKTHPKSRSTTSNRGTRDPLSDSPSVTSAATAPPVRMRAVSPGADDDPSTAKRGRPPIGEVTAGGMEIVGDRHRSIEVVGRKPAELVVRVRLLGELPVAARVMTDDPWLTVSPDRLSPRKREHLLTVTVHGDKMFNDEDRSAVRLFNDLGEQVEIEVSARRSVNWNGLVIAGFAALGVVGLGLATWLIISALTPSSAAFLQVIVDPTAEAIVLDGDKIGSGQIARIANPATGPHKLTVVQRNFEPYEATITLQADEGRTIEVPLRLSSSLDFRPHPDAKKGRIADPLALDPVRVRMEKCTAQTPRDHAPYALVATMSFERDGAVAGVRLASNDHVPTEVAVCLRRTMAAGQVEVVDGDWTDVTMDVSYP